MLSTAAQYEHFAVPSNATTVLLDRLQFLQFQLFKACSINVPAFFADTGDGHAFAWGKGPSEGARIPYHWRRMVGAAGIEPATTCPQSVFRAISDGFAESYRQREKALQAAPVALSVSITE